MLAFDIWIDGVRLARAGCEDWSVLSAHVTAVKERGGARQRDGELEFSVGGLSQSDADGAAHHFRWAKRDLAVGSKVMIEVIETDAPDPPVRRYRSDREVQESPYSDEEIEQFEREELRRLKAKFEPWQGDEQEAANVMLTRYLNTDLDIESKTDLRALTDDLSRRKWVVLHSGQHDDGVWRASFEHLWNSEAGAEQAIAGMLDVLERLPDHLKTIWTAGQKRDFNIGIQAEQWPHAFGQTLSNELLARVASAGASISITVYAAPRCPD